MLSCGLKRDLLREQADISTEKLKGGVGRCPGRQGWSEQAQPSEERDVLVRYGPAGGVGQLGPVRAWDRVTGAGVPSS